jgi:hypothetical protein
VRRVKRRKANGAVAAVVLGVLACAGIAAAAGKVAGGSYTGALAAPKTAYVVSFKVSSNGKKVTGLGINSTPFYCSGGGPPTPVKFANASISKAGTFTSAGKYVIAVGPFKGQVETQLKITGKFGKNGTERGTLTSTYPKATACTGKSSYTTTRT